jgi:hypothetical protein
MFRSTSLLGGALVTAVLLFPQTAGKPPAPAKPAPHISIPKVTPRSEDVSTIDGMVKAYYEVVSGPADQPRQWGRDATLYIPGMRFVIIAEDPTGNAAAESMTHQEFVDSSEAALNGKPFYEREIHRVIHRAGNIAHVLSTAEHRSSENGPVEGRGIDSLDLYWDGTRWWIASANLWEINTAKHPLQREFLP